MAALADARSACRRSECEGGALGIGLRGAILAALHPEDGPTVAELGGQSACAPLVHHAPSEARCAKRETVAYTPYCTTMVILI